MTARARWTDATGRSWGGYPQRKYDTHCWMIIDEALVNGEWRPYSEVGSTPEGVSFHVSHGRLKWS